MLCRAQSLRQESNGYEGDTNRAFVQIGNGLAAVSALLYLLTALMGNIPALEQPLNSCMPLYSVVNAVLTFCETYRVTTYHGSFGAETVKPLQILSPSARIHSLIRSKPSFLAPSDDSSLVTRDDSGSFTGQKQQLTQSQAYTENLVKLSSLLFLADSVCVSEKSEVKILIHALLSVKRCSLILHCSLTVIH